MRFPIVAVAMLVLASCGKPPDPNWSAGSLDDVTRIAFIQAGLASHGYSVGLVDGVADQRTLAAAEQYRRANNLPGPNSLDSGLLESLFKSRNYHNGLPSHIAVIRVCLSHGVERAVIFRSNGNYITCTIASGDRPTSITRSVGLTNCENSMYFGGGHVSCRIIYDGGRLLTDNIAADLNPTYPTAFPGVMKTYDAKSGKSSTFDVVVESNEILYRPDLTQYGWFPVETSVPAIIREKNGRVLCRGRAFMPQSLISRADIRYEFDCFNKQYQFSGTAKAVGVYPRRGGVVPVFRVTLEHEGSWMKIVPPPGYLH